MGWNYNSMHINHHWIIKYRIQLTTILLADRADAHSTQYDQNWHHHAVRLPMGLTRLFIVWLMGSVYMAKSCTIVFLADKFLFVGSDTFAVGCIVYPQNAPEKKSRRKCEGEFLGHKNHTCKRRLASGISTNFMTIAVIISLCSLCRELAFRVCLIVTGAYKNLV